eukprot:COSAG02_NODE_41413_length_395_cov_0.489865_1_plen_95_part_10
MPSGTPPLRAAERDLVIIRRVRPDSRRGVKHPRPAGIHHHRHPLIDIHISNKSAVRNLNGEAAFVQHAETQRQPSSSPRSQTGSGDHPTRATRFC